MKHKVTNELQLKKMSSSYDASLTTVRTRLIATHRMASGAETAQYNSDMNAIHANCTHTANTKAKGSCTAVFL